MTLPLSGPLEASDINVELGRSATAVMSIKDAATGVYGAINTCSPYYPNGSAPHAYSEWYGYNHLAPCLNSNFAFSPQSTGTPNFLRSDTLDYPTVVSSTKPSARGQFTLSMWIKIDSNIINTNVGYLTSLSAGPTSPTFLLRLVWSSVFNAGTGVYNNTFNLVVGNATTSGFTSTVDVSDTNNTGLTGVPDGSTLDQTGYLDANGYFLITCVIDYNNIGTADYVSWYWNDSLLTSQTTVPGAVQSPNYSGYDLAVGAWYVGEVASGCLIDGYALFIDTALNQTDVTAIYNGGAVASIGTYVAISSSLLFYNFESANPNIGDETGGTFNFDLNEINSPRRVQPPAA